MPITPLDNAGAYSDVQGNRHGNPPRQATTDATITPIGGNQDVALMRGMEAFVRSTAAVEQELTNTANTLRIISERSQRMYGQQASGAGPTVMAMMGPQDPNATAMAVRAGIEEAMSSVLARFPVPPPVGPAAGGGATPIGNVMVGQQPGYGVAVRGEEVIAPGEVRAESILHPYRQQESEVGEGERRRSRGLVEPLRRARQPEGRPLPYQVSPATRGDVETTDEMRGTTPEGPSNYERYQAGREYNVGQLRKDVFRSVGKHLSQIRTPGEQLEQKWVPLPEGQEGPPTPTWFHKMPEGAAGPAAPAAEEEIASFGRREAVAGVARNIGGSLMEGQGAGRAIMSVLPEGAGLAAGAVTGGAMLVNQGLNYATNQRAENARWQEIMGGSNFEGFGQRARAQAFEWGMKGTMGAGQAGQLYYGTAETGLRGGQRNDAIDFAVDAYRRFGMSVQESMELIKVAAETGQTSFKGLTSALEDVTKAARTAGVNAQQARSIFTQQYAQLATEVGPQAAPIMAGAFATQQAGLGREFQNVSFQGMNTPDMLRIAAAQQGTTLGGLQQRINEPGGAAVGVAASQSVVNNVARQIMGQGGLSAIQGYMAANKPQSQGNYSKGQYDQMSKLLAQQGLDPQVVAQVLGQFGIQGLDLNNAIPMLAHIATGGWDPAGQAAKDAANQRTAGATRQLQTAGLRDPTTGKWRSPGSISLGNMTPAEADEINRLQGRDPRDPTRDLQGKPLPNGGADQPGLTDPLMHSYISGALKTGRAGGISQLVGQHDPRAADIQQVQVKTASGSRVVSMQDAMKYYRDQIDRGDAIVMNGDQAGVSVADAMKVQGDQDMAVTSDTSKDLGTKGTSQADWEKKHPTSHVLVSPTPELARILQFGGLNVSQGHDPLSPPPAQQQPWDRPPG